MNKESGQALALLFVIGMLVIVGMFALGYTSYIHEIMSPFSKLYLALGQP